jgi:hypothetical protein
MIAANTPLSFVSVNSVIVGISELFVMKSIRGNGLILVNGVNMLNVSEHFQLLSEERLSSLRNVCNVPESFVFFQIEFSEPIMEKIENVQRPKVKGIKLEDISKCNLLPLGAALNYKHAILNEKSTSLGSVYPEIVQWLRKCNENNWMILVSSFMFHQLYALLDSKEIRNKMLDEITPVKTDTDLSTQSSTKSGRVELSSFVKVQTKPEPVETEESQAGNKSVDVLGPEVDLSENAIEALPDLSWFTEKHSKQLLSEFKQTLKALGNKEPAEQLLMDPDKLISVLPDYVNLQPNPLSLTCVGKFTEVSEKQAVNLAKIYISLLFEPYDVNTLIRSNEKNIAVLDTSLRLLLTQVTAMFLNTQAHVRVARNSRTTNLGVLIDLMSLLRCLTQKEPIIDYTTIEKFLTLTHHLGNVVLEPVINILSALHNPELTNYRNWLKRSKAPISFFLMNFFQGFLDKKVDYDSNSAYTALVTMKSLYSRDGQFDENLAGELLTYGGNTLRALFVALGLEDIFQYTVGVKESSDIKNIYQDVPYGLPTTITTGMRAKNLIRLINNLDELSSLVDMAAIIRGVSVISSELLNVQALGSTTMPEKPLMSIIKQFGVSLNLFADQENEIGDSTIKVFDAVFQIFDSYTETLSKQRINMAPNKVGSLLSQLTTILKLNSTAN